ncbi:MAG: hypothetical protein HN995_02575 [Candidatus Marinimicrobia bacterium]|jgi:hypothetical protein|nr:hypothetical protein [Candidatus Neomarinimicrobiota bacterium]MBT3576413.1 hypothetical protein [Candidatus Neomarinimicrobiota bacterium]MBT3678929.1 hypothetical protein [Candidatus Neomarinimicrobiota bacterium]MBT3950495.1 hypothetical protein [Candidatus Neomarinimicrobiota bacterium]MBT4251781.1 hypothetical protein [Candidatus Neomarinimicrobiota bacterium]
MTEEEKQPEQEEEQVKSDRGSKLMGDMMKGLRDFGSAALDKAEEYGKIASEKAEELTKLGKIKLDIHQLNRSRTKNLSELGELVFNLGEDKKLKDLAKHENYVALVKSIKDLDVEIKEKEAQAETVEIEEASEDKE